MSKLSKVAQLLAKSEIEARRFCLQVQGHYKGEKPSFAAIAEFLEKHPTTPKNAETIAKAAQAGNHKLGTVTNVKNNLASHSSTPPIAPIQYSTSTNGLRTEIIGVGNNLASLLKSFKSSKIDIAVAFASKTEDLIRAILDNGNKLTLTVGTINHFSDPVFINYCCDIAKKNPTRFELSVDFRADDSIHWKLYLVGPGTVIIGSTNLTMIGISMERDTAVRIHDKSLYQNYSSLLDKLRQNDFVVKYGDAKFDSLFAEYENQHRRINPRSLSDPQITSDFVAWANQDKSQILPILIWDREVTPEDQKTFKEKIEPKITSDESEAMIGKGVHIVGVWEGKKNEQYYHSGDVILTMKYSGAHIKFDMAYAVIYDAGRWWLCGCSWKAIPKPFALTPELKRIIKSKTGSWDKAGKRYLNSNDLQELARLSKKLKTLSLLPGLTNKHLQRTVRARFLLK